MIDIRVEVSGIGDGGASAERLRARVADRLRLRQVGRRQSVLAAAAAEAGDDGQPLAPSHVVFVK